MTNRQLTKHELQTLAYPLLIEVRGKLQALSSGNQQLLWALRLKIYKELLYDERGKPMQRRALKKRQLIKQNNRCACCKKMLSLRGNVLDRLDAMTGYTLENTRVLCQKCDLRIQEERDFK